MKANVLELLMGLFASKIDAYPQAVVEMSVEDALALASCNKTDVANALNWIDSLTKQAQAVKKSTPPSDGSIRMYTSVERDRISPECIQTLTEWQRAGVISALQREVIIEQVLSIEVPMIETTHLRWVAFLVLTASAENIEQIYWLDYILLSSDETIKLH